MDKQDITMYGEQELSLHFMNTEHLYNAMRRCALASQLREAAETWFVFTEEQWEELVADWADDQDE